MPRRSCRWRAADGGLGVAEGGEAVERRAFNVTASDARSFAASKARAVGDAAEGGAAGVAGVRLFAPRRAETYRDQDDGKQRQQHQPACRHGKVRRPPAHRFCRSEPKNDSLMVERLRTATVERWRGTQPSSAPRSRRRPTARPLNAAATAETGPTGAWSRRPEQSHPGEPQ